MLNSNMPSLNTLNSNQQQNLKTVILVGSGRELGNTAEYANEMAESFNAEVINLANWQISPYNYNNESEQDEFMVLAEQLLDYERIILASPVYWYAPSAQMKVFLDRLTDLITYSKENGRKLRGIASGVLATGATEKPAECFEQMFKLTFDYLGMPYQGMLYRAAQ